MTSTASTRAEREAQAYDEGDVTANCQMWVTRVRHVLECENTQRAERQMRERMRRVPGGRAVEIGCAEGRFTAEMHEMGFADVLGVDVSAAQIEDARQTYGDLEGVRFEAVSAEEPLRGTFDLIVGRSVLHHLDFREAMQRLYTDNLAPGGHMVFMEPMSHPFTLAFHTLVRSAHTDDEWPLTPADVDWMRESFTHVEVMPINLVSFPAGIVSSYVFSTADNALMRAADEIDRRLAGKPAMIARGRHGLIDVTKAL